MNKNFIKENNGITLMTLVITIIILLILAGITINFLVGDNGILERVRTAKEETKKANAIEDVKMAWMEILTEYETRTGEDTSKTKTDYYTKTNVADNLNDGTIAEDEGSFLYSENAISRVVYVNKQNERYLVEIDAYGNVQIAESSNIKGNDEFVSTAHSVTISKGGTYQITSSSELTWTSANTDIATVTTDGTKVVITGVEEGTTIITGENENGTTVIDCTMKVTSSGGSVYAWKKYKANKSSIYGYTLKDYGEISFNGSSGSGNTYQVFTSFSFDYSSGKFLLSDSRCMTPVCMGAYTNGTSSQGVRPLYVIGNGGNNFWDYNLGSTNGNRLIVFGHRTGYWDSKTYLVKASLTSYVSYETYSNSGQEMEEVNSENPLAYPSNGAQGGYWYVLQGVK